MSSIKRVQTSGFSSLWLRISVSTLFMNESPHVKESGFRNPGNFCNWNPESWALESGIQVYESRIPITIRIRNPSSTEKDLESSNWNPESTAWNPESKSVLDSLTRGEMKLEKATSIFVPMAVPCVWSSFFHKTGMSFLEELALALVLVIV